MGVNRIKNTNKKSEIIKVLFVIVISFFLIFPSVIYNVNSIQIYSNLDRKIVAKLSKEVEIPAGTDYFIKYDSKNLTLNDQTNPFT